MPLEDSKQESERAMVNRRSVLGTIGGASATTLFAIPASGASISGKNHLIGQTYDTVTHRAQRTASADIEKEERGIRGRLRIGGFDVPFGHEEPLKAAPESGRYSITRSGDEYTEDGIPLKIKFRILGGTIVGTATRPSGDFGTLGFTLTGENEIGRAQTIEKGLQNRGQGVAPKGYNKAPPVRSVGIPKNTSFRSIVRGGEK